MPKKDTPPEQYVGEKLYYRLGQAIAQWANVEDAMLRVFWNLLERPDFILTSVIFYTPISDKIRADMIDNVAKFVLSDSPLLDEWKKLRRHIRKKGETRNRLAHLMAIHDSENQEKSILRPHLFDATITHKYINKPMPSYNAKQLKEVTQSFGRLSQRLWDFVKKIQPPSEQPQQPDS